MKNIFGLVRAIAIVTLAGQANAQNLNWASMQQGQRHVINLNVGWDYAVNFGSGYSYVLKTKIPVVLGGQFSIPSGERLTDDFKVKLGGQAMVIRSGNFLTTIVAYGIIRRTESELASLWNFGSEFDGIAGYYKSSWFVAGEFGFDKAIATHVKNSNIMKENYPLVKDAWYVPTGGNFRYGVQGGYCFKSLDINLKIGMTSDQRFKPTVLIPFYLQLGVNKRF